MPDLRHKLHLTQTHISTLPAIVHFFQSFFLHKTDDIQSHFGKG